MESRFWANCTIGGSESFDLAWQPDGFASYSHSGTQQMTFGGLAARESGQYVSRSARANGTGLGLIFTNVFRGIDDTKGADVSRDIVTAAS